VGCGQQQEKEVEYVIDKPAWGDGACDQAKLGKKIQQCMEEKSPECCSVGENSHWAEPIDGYTCSADGTYNLVNTNACSTSGMENPPIRTKKCCYVGEWVKDGCNQDNKLDRIKYTRTIVNQEMCTDEELMKDTNVIISGGRMDSSPDYFYKDNPTVKYTLNKDECYQECEVENLGHSPPYEVSFWNNYCMGNVKYKIIKEGRGSGNYSPSCLDHVAGHRAVGEVYTEKRKISDEKGGPCPP
jgi:hypothetical protein